MTVLMKRFRDDDEVEKLAMANCLMLISRLEENNNGLSTTSFTGRVYRCKTCDKSFQSFQALGGHRASHKKPKLFASDLSIHSPTSPSKNKTHECSICGLDFPIGQALGGHMRRHRAEKAVEDITNISLAPAVMTVNKKLNSQRDLCLDVDLNLKLGNQPGPILQLGF